MEIKYDKSGQPLPWDQQEASKIPPVSPEASPATSQAAAPVQQDDISDVQLANPFVQEYLAQQRAQQQPAVETAPQEEPESVDVDSDPEIEEPAPKKQDHPNFRALREAAERAERERDEYARLLRERDLLDRQSRSPQPKDEEPDDSDIADDGFVEPKHIKKLRQEIKALKREQTEYKQKTAKEMQEMMLYKQYPNIDEVVSPENLAILKEMKPAYARQLAELHQRGDIYGTGELAYNYMMDLGIYKSKATSTKDYAAEKMRARINASKPRPIVSGTAKNSTGDSPLARAHAFGGELSDADMRRHYMEMEAAIRNRGD